MCKISQLAEKNTGQLAIRRAYRTGALFFIIRAYCIYFLVPALWGIDLNVFPDAFK